MSAIGRKRPVILLNFHRIERPLLRIAAVQKLSLKSFPANVRFIPGSCRWAGRIVTGR